MWQLNKDGKHDRNQPLMHCPFKMESYQTGYDLLDMLSRRRNYAKSHVRQKVPLLTWDALQYVGGEIEYSSDVGISGNG